MECGKMSAYAYPLSPQAVKVKLGSREPATIEISSFLYSSRSSFSTTCTGNQTPYKCSFAIRFTHTTVDSLSSVPCVGQLLTAYHIPLQ